MKKSRKIRKDVKSYIIPEGTTYIEKDMFYDCSKLSNVVIPNSVRSIGDWAFAGCESLKTIVIPEGVTKIEKYVFSQCSALSSITIPNSVTSIGRAAFSDCSSLTSVTIPEGVTSIGDHAFHKCESLKSIAIPDSVTSIGDNAFDGCSSLTTVVISSNVKEIQRDTFKECTNLENIIISENTKIHRDAFKDTQWLKNKPKGVVYVGKGAYKSKGAMPGRCAVLRDGTVKIFSQAFKSTQLRSVVVPSSVRELGEEAFMNCNDLSYAVISKSVTSIKGHAFWRKEPKTELEIHWYPNDACYLDCADDKTILYLYKDETNSEKVEERASRYNKYRNFKKIIIRDAAEFKDAIKKCICSSKWGADGDGEFSIDGISDLIEIDKAIRKLKDKTSEVSTTLESGVFSENLNIKSITIPGTVQSIGEFAFMNCKRLENITIPESVKEIDYAAFCDCDNLKTVNIASASPLLDNEELLKMFPECEINKY